MEFLYSLNRLDVWPPTHPLLDAARPLASDAAQCKKEPNADG
jgi:hypothetical protein